MGRRTALFFCFVLTSVVSGQDFRATVTGIVGDPSGAAIPRAAIKATNIANNQVQETTSTVVGLYTIPYLEPGVYNIEATAPGFQTLKRQGITLEVSQKLNLPLQLAVGEATSAVTVTGEQESITTTNS